MKEENIQEAYNLAETKYTLQSCIRMIENAKDINDIECAIRRSNLAFSMPSLELLKNEFLQMVNSEIEIIDAKIEAL